jgi:hypothetical protein
VFLISALHEGDQTEDAFEGKLATPDPSAMLTKDLMIKRLKAGDLDVDIRGSVNSVHDYLKQRVSLVTDLRITATMVLHAEKHGGAYRSYRIGDVQINHSNLFKVHLKVPEKDCPETVETQATANGSVAVGSGSLTLLFPRAQSRRSRPTGIRFDFSQTVPGPDRPGGGQHRSGLSPPQPALPVGNQGAHSFLSPSRVSEIRWRMPRAIPGLDNACARTFPAAVVPSADASACGRGLGPALDPRNAGFET